MITDEVFAMLYRISDKWSQLWGAAQQDLHIRKCIAKPQNISYRKQRTARFMRCALVKLVSYADKHTQSLSFFSLIQFDLINLKLLVFPPGYCVNNVIGKIHDLRSGMRLCCGFCLLRRYND